MKTPAPAAPCSYNRVFFSTLRLRDALPESFVQNLGLQYYAKQQAFSAALDREHRLLEARKRLFARYDNALDLEQYGCGIFREPTLARILADEIARIDGPDCRVFACSIQPNHLHLLLELSGSPPNEMYAGDLECLPNPALRALLSRIQQNTETPLKSEISRLGETLDSKKFQKQGPNGNVVMEGKLWHERSFDFRVPDAAAFERAAQFILHKPQ